MSETMTKGKKVDAVNAHVMDVLTVIRGGDLMFDLSQKLQEVIAGVRESGKKGSITLKLVINPLSTGNGDTVGVKDTIRIDVPKKTVNPTLFFTTTKNTMQRKDPRQDEFPAEAGFAQQE
jgi:hypothetical protein